MKVKIPILTFELLCLYNILLLYEHRGTLSEIWQSSSRALSLSPHTHTYIFMYVYIHACAFGRRSASVCLSFLSFFPSFSLALSLSNSIDGIAQNIEKERKEREREKGNLMMMSILWHRAHIERKKESSKISIERGKGEKESTLPVFFSFLLFYSLCVSLSLPLICQLYV